MIGVTFGNKHSYTDLSLLLSNVAITPPEPKRYTVDVPGSNGILDLTSGITQNICYRNRQMQITFNVIGACNLQQKVSEVSNAIHGKRLHVKFDRDPDYYWDAFVTVTSAASEQRTTSIVVLCDCQPYKLKLSETSYEISGSGTLSCVNGRMEVVPTIVCTADATVVLGDITKTYTAGTHIEPDFLLDEGTHTFTITSAGDTTIKYREGAL